MGKHLVELTFLGRYQRHPCELAVELRPQSSLIAATRTSSPHYPRLDLGPYCLEGSTSIHFRTRTDQVS